MTHQISVNGRAFKVCTGRFDGFWKRVNRGVWEPETFKSFDTYVTKDTLVVDFGAWIGPTALYSVQSAGACVAMEPDRVAFEELQRNVALNQDAPWAARLTLSDKGIHPSGQPITISGSKDGGDSMTTALLQTPGASWTIETERLQDVIARHRGTLKHVLVKMDIEGGEYDLVPDIAELLADPDITFMISVHPRILKHSLQNKHDQALTWAQEHIEVLQRFVGALPWTREIVQPDGASLVEAQVRETARKGKFGYREIVVR